MVKRGKLQSFEKLRDKFGLDEHEQNQYRQIRDYYEKEINEVINVFLKAYEGKTCKVISTLYKGLLSYRKTSSLYIKEKWELELKEQITEEEWFVICKTHPLAPGVGENSIGKIWSDFS